VQALKFIACFVGFFFFLGKYEKSDLLKKHAGLGRRHFVLSGQSYQLLATAVTAINNLNDLNDKNQQSLKELTGHSKPKEVNKERVDYFIYMWTRHLSFVKYY
jgi:hypothetical protein